MCISTVHYCCRRNVSYNSTRLKEHHILFLKGIVNIVGRRARKDNWKEMRNGKRERRGWILPSALPSPTLPPSILFPPLLNFYLTSVLFLGSECNPVAVIVFTWAYCMQLCHVTRPLMYLPRCRQLVEQRLTLEALKDWFWYWICCHCNYTGWREWRYFPVVFFWTAWLWSDKIHRYESFSHILPPPPPPLLCFCV